MTSQTIPPDLLSTHSQGDTECTWHHMSVRTRTGQAVPRKHNEKVFHKVPCNAGVAFMCRGFFPGPAPLHNPGNPLPTQHLMRVLSARTVFSQFPGTQHESTSRRFTPNLTSDAHFLRGQVSQPYSFPANPWEVLNRNLVATANLIAIYHGAIQQSYTPPTDAEKRTQTEREPIYGVSTGSEQACCRWELLPKQAPLGISHTHDSSRAVSQAPH
jgi:hypothetical protein